MNNKMNDYDTIATLLQRDLDDTQIDTLLWCLNVYDWEKIKENRSSFSRKVQMCINMLEFKSQRTNIKVRQADPQIFIKQRMDTAEKYAKKRDEIWEQHKKIMNIARPLQQCDADAVSTFHQIGSVNDEIDEHNKNKKPALKRNQIDQKLTELTEKLRKLENEYSKQLEKIKFEDDFWDAEQRYRYFVIEMC